MAIDWNEYDKTVDTARLAEDVKESAKNGGRENVPHGEYEVRIKKLELTRSKTKNDPMLVCWFQVIAGPYSKSYIFMNKIVKEPYPIHLADEFLESLVSEDPNKPVVEFRNYSQYNKLIMDIAEMVMGNYEYALKYSENKGFDDFKITAVFPLE